MEEFQFNGDWETIIFLSKLWKERDRPNNAFRQKQLNSETFELLIDDVFDEEPDPSKEQLNTISFLQEETNQDKIIANLFNYIVEVISPEYQELSERFPKLSELKDLKEVIGLDHVIVLRFGKADHAYYNLMFETSLDREHGLGFVMHKDIIIEHGGIGDLSYEQVAKHMGMEYEAYLQYQSKIQTEPTKTYQKPSKKYGKLKPWQKELNSQFHFILYSNGDDTALIHFIESGKITLEKAFGNLRLRMVRDHRTGLLEYFKSKGYK